MALTLSFTGVHARAGCACAGCKPAARAARATRGAAPRAGRRALTVVADSRKAVVVLTGTAGVAGTVTFSQEGSGALRRQHANPGFALYDLCA